MTIIERKGNLITLAQAGEFDVIVQGSNCFNTMGKGLALEMKKAFPECYEADCNTIKGDKSKLGGVSIAESGDLIIVNAYTQYYYGNKPGHKAPVDYEAVRQCLRLVKANYGHKRIGLPRIGAGLAGGEWKVIHAIIEGIFGHECGEGTVTVVTL